MKKRHLISILAVTVVIGGGVFSFNPFNTADEPAVDTFKSEEAFQDYIEQAPSPTTGFTTGARATADLQESAAPRGDSAASGAGRTTVNRYSETNVQEEGIQEPDILKSDGERFFFSPESRYVMQPIAGDQGNIGDIQRQKRNISAFKTLPAENASEIGEIDTNGRMLLYEDTLLVFGQDKIQGINVNEARDPEQLYELELNGSIVTSRRTGDTVYIVLQERINNNHICPIRPMETMSVPCTDVYRPNDPAPADTTYTALQMDIETGEVAETTTMVGTAANTNVYMSEDNLYLTYRDQQSRTDILFDFLLNDAKDLLNQTVVERIENVSSYDIGDRAKITELGRIIQQYEASLSKDEARNLRESFQNRLGNYTEDHKRDFITTGIVQIGTDELTVKETGEVPGWTLDQFSMDEHDGRLRIATTVGSRQLGTAVESANDLYILNDKLNIESSVQDMGITERIYSVRFLDDTAYIVTFRRIDPFHVLDLSDPNNPVLKGELKLPGFSSYLHPIDENRVLGVGEEGSHAKVVMFNVSDPTDPQVAHDVILDEYGTDIGQTHHAFLIDRRHNVFFIPGQDKAYIFSYENGMDVTKTVDLNDPKRARFVNNYLYIFSNNELVVLDESDWTEVNRVSFGPSANSNQ